MAIFQIAEYEVKPDAVEQVKQAIRQFVHDVETNQPGTLLYTAWQQQQRPTCFTHVFIFEDAAAREAHSRSNAVRQFEAVYSSELVGRVVFTDYEQVATTQWLQTATR